MPAATSPSAIDRFRSAALTLCLFLFVVGANWATFDRFGSDMPDWDQWDAEGLNLLAPWCEHDHFVAHLFTPHNEHRVILTKLQNLAVVTTAGQWDSRAEVFFNAALHGLIAIGFWVIGRRWIAARWQVPYYVATAALYGLPLAWQNLLGGFHSQQYWLIGLSFVGILVLPFAKPWRGRWWLGLLATTVVLGSMGSGFLVAATIFAVVVWRWLQRQMMAREAWPTLIAMAVLIAIGDLTRVEVYYHAQLKAKTAHDFIFSVLRSLEWPLRDHDWAGAVLWFPFIVATVVTFVDRRNRRSRAGQTIIALGGWVIIQLLATAYARGAGADYPASRYMDTLIFGTAINALALGWLLSGSGHVAPATNFEPSAVSRDPSLLRATSEPGGTASIVSQIGVWLIGVGWLVALVAGLHALVVRNVTAELPSTRQYYVDTEAHLRAYLATNDPAELVEPIPYPSASALIERLAHQSLRELMPASVRPALPVTADVGTGDSGFVANRATQRLLNSAPRAGLSPDTPALASRPTWGSFNGNGAANTAEWRSAPIAAPVGGWLRFETAGNLGEPGVDLELRDAGTDAIIARVRPKKVPGNTWRSVYVPAPQRPFVIVARDADPQRWLAFSAPVEMSSLSYACWQGVKNGRLIAEITAILAAAIGLAALFGTRPQAACGGGLSFGPAE